MKINEFKTRAISGIYQLIDNIFDSTSLPDKMCNGICKQVVKSNINKYDSFLNMICDENGHIQVDEIEKIIPEHFEIDMEDISRRWDIPSWMIPKKILLLTREDILNIIKG